MAMNESSNLLLSASHYHHSSNAYHPPRTIMESVMHSVQSDHPMDRRASSVQSLNAFFSHPKPSTATSYPHLQQSSNQLGLAISQLASPLLPPPPPLAAPNALLPSSIGENRPIHASLCRIDSLYSRRTSIPLNRVKEDRIPYFRQKSLDESTISTPISKVTDTNALENNDSQQKNSEPIEIRVRCIFSRVGEIDTLNERFTAEIFFEASWYDRERHPDSKYDPQLGYFNPQLVVLNHIGDTLRHEKWYSTGKTNQTGIIEVTEHHKIRGIFWERMELNHFPYDVQELSLSLTTPLTSKDLYFSPNKQKPSGVNRTVFSDQQSWYLYEHVEFNYEQHREEYSLNFNQIHPVVVCTCHVGRKCGYYIWNAYFLIFLITSASLCTFAIPPSNTHGRLQITCTLLLTSVTFRWVVNKSLPTISYLTALDVYAISSIVVLCIINVFHGVISYIYYNQIYEASAQTPPKPTALHLSLYPDYALCRLDRYGFFIFLSSFCLYQIVILFWTVWVPYKRRRAMSQKDEKNRAQLTNTISKEFVK